MLSTIASTLLDLASVSTISFLVILPLNSPDYVFVTLFLKHREDVVGKYDESETCDDEQECGCVVGEEDDCCEEEGDGECDARCLAEPPPVDFAECFDEFLDFHFSCH